MSSSREDTEAWAPGPSPRLGQNPSPPHRGAAAESEGKGSRQKAPIPTSGLRWLDLPGTLRPDRTAGGSAAQRSAGRGAGFATATRLPTAALGTARYSGHSQLKDPTYRTPPLKAPSWLRETEEPLQPGAPHTARRHAPSELAGHPCPRPPARSHGPTGHFCTTWLGRWNGSGGSLPRAPALAGGRLSPERTCWGARGFKPRSPRCPGRRHVELRRGRVWGAQSVG